MTVKFGTQHQCWFLSTCGKMWRLEREWLWLNSDWGLAARGCWWYFYNSSLSIHTWCSLLALRWYPLTIDKEGPLCGLSLGLCAIISLLIVAILVRLWKNSECVNSSFKLIDTHAHKDVFSNSNHFYCYSLCNRTSSISSNSELKPVTFFRSVFDTHWRYTWASLCADLCIFLWMVQINRCFGEAIISPMWTLGYMCCASDNYRI